jgi:hypothetical protein
MSKTSPGSNSRREKLFGSLSKSYQGPTFAIPLGRLAMAVSAERRSGLHDPGYMVFAATPTNY